MAVACALALAARLSAAGAADAAPLPEPPAEALPAPTPAPTPPAPAPAAPAGRMADDLAHQIGRQLRCPVCQGMPISESPSTMAQDMMRRVRVLLAEGRSEDQVFAYFVERYGEWVLLAPPQRGFFLTVWVLPPLLLAATAAWAVAHMRRLRAAPPAAPAAAAAAPPPPPEADGALLQAIRREVDR